MKDVKEILVNLACDIFNDAFRKDATIDDSDLIKLEDEAAAELYRLLESRAITVQQNLIEGSRGLEAVPLDEIAKLCGQETKQGVITPEGSKS